MSGKFAYPMRRKTPCFSYGDITKDSMELFQEIGSTDKSLRIYAHLLHEIFNEPVKSQIMDDVILWLNARV